MIGAVRKATDITRAGVILLACHFAWEHTASELAFVSVITLVDGLEDVIPLDL